MALYAFDGTLDFDQELDGLDTNVVRFKELYNGDTEAYLEGVGTRHGVLGKALGGVFGFGGRARINEMYDLLCEKYKNGDKQIDIVGFSRGAALALHFANKLHEEGIDGISEKPTIRYLGLWDVVGSFGLSFNNILKFQDINLGWDIKNVANSVSHCCHAMALDERRESFDVTRLNHDRSHANVEERWFRGTHGDIGGGNQNPLRSNIAFHWIYKRARDCGVPLKDISEIQSLPANDPDVIKYVSTDRFAPIMETKDIWVDPRREVLPDDIIDETAHGLRLAIGESHQTDVYSKLKYSWTGIEVQTNETYEVKLVDPTDTWLDGIKKRKAKTRNDPLHINLNTGKPIECGPDGWDAEVELNGIKDDIVQAAERFRRHPQAAWFELVGIIGDTDRIENMVRLGDAKTGDTFTAPSPGELYMFANDLKMKYNNNAGLLTIRITRLKDAPA